MIYSKLGVDYLTFEVVVVGLVKTRHDFLKKSFIALGIFFSRDVSMHDIFSRPCDTSYPVTKPANFYSEATYLVEFRSGKHITEISTQLSILPALSKLLQLLLFL